MRQDGESIGRSLPKKPVWKNLQTVVGLVNKLKNEGCETPGKLYIGKKHGQIKHT